MIAVKTVRAWVLILAMILAAAPLPADSGADTETSDGSGSPPDKTCEAGVDCGEGDAIVIPGTDPLTCVLGSDDNVAPVEEFSDYLTCLGSGLAGPGFDVGTAITGTGSGLITVDDPAGGPITDVCHIESDPNLRYLRIKLHDTTGVAKILKFDGGYAPSGIDFAAGGPPSTIEITVDGQLVVVIVPTMGSIDAAIKSAINQAPGLGAGVVDRYIHVIKSGGVAEISILVRDTGLIQSGLGIDPNVADSTACDPYLIYDPGSSGSGTK